MKELCTMKLKHIFYMKKFFLYILIIYNLFETSCNQSKTTSNEGITLADAYSNYFLIGTSLSLQQLNSQVEPIVRQHFNSITCENEMKAAIIHPAEHVYNFGPADSIVDYAVKFDKKIRGHCLIWHQQCPDWFFREGNQLASKEILLKRMQDHIFAIVSRYKGKVYCWDVVNEAIDDDSTLFLRPTNWYQILGEDYIAKAFEYAHHADPSALLFYNDYNTERSEKRERVYKLLKSLIDKKVPIHGIGLQGHWTIYEPSEKNLSDAIKKFASLGLIIHITELDVSLFPWEKYPRKKLPGEVDTLTAELVQKFNYQYEIVFRTFIKHKNEIKSVTFWGVADHLSWLNNYPVEGRKNYPLLFDKNLQPKPIYYRLINLVR